MWYTQDPTPTSTVRYGTQPLRLTLSAGGTSSSYLAGYGRHHRVSLAQLTPATTYYYSVGDATTGLSTVRSFVSPSTGPNASFSLSVFGDWGYD